MINRILITFCLLTDLQPGDTFESKIIANLLTAFPLIRDGDYQVWWTVRDLKSEVLDFRVNDGKLPLIQPKTCNLPQINQAGRDQTLAETRVVLLSVSPEQTHVLKPAPDRNATGANIDVIVTNIAISYVVERIGTNSSANPVIGSVLLYLKKNGQRGVPLDFNGIGFSFGPGVDSSSRLPRVHVMNPGACFTYHCLLKEVHYFPNTRVDCMIQQGFGENLHDFEFNDIPLP